MGPTTRTCEDGPNGFDMVATPPMQERGYVTLFWYHCEFAAVGLRVPIVDVKFDPSVDRLCPCYLLRSFALSPVGLVSACLAGCVGLATMMNGRLDSTRPTNCLVDEQRIGSDERRETRRHTHQRTSQAKETISTPAQTYECVHIGRLHPAIWRSSSTTGNAFGALQIPRDSVTIDARVDAIITSVPISTHHRTTWFLSACNLTLPRSFDRRRE